MKCPHCTNGFFPKWKTTHVDTNEGSYWDTRSILCPECNNNTIFLQNKKAGSTTIMGEFMVLPRNITRPLGSKVPEKYSKPFHQAVSVLSISPEASAAISRRCLQDLLREESKITHGDLAGEIQQVIDSNTLPSGLAESIDAIRNIGNFGSHPIKSANTGEIVEVELGEAEWTIDVLEELFDHYLVKPAILQAKKDALNLKLEDAGKHPMK